MLCSLHDRDQSSATIWTDMARAHRNCIFIVHCRAITQSTMYSWVSHSYCLIKISLTRQAHTHTDLKLMAIIKRETLDPFVGHIFTLHPAHKHRYYIRFVILWRPFLLSLYRLESHSKISHSLWMRSHSMQLHVIGCYENVQLLKISNLIRRFSTPPFMLSSPWLLLLFFFFN